MTEQICENCKWFCDVTPEDNQFPPVPQFECRRYAPRILHGSGAGWSDTKWPKVSPGDFCGEFEEAKK